MADEPTWIAPSAPQPVEAESAFVGLEARVGDFWKFALGDLRMNNARGYLAEFIIARSLGLTDAARIEWAPYDVLWGDITIEVKSAAYLQSWEQRRLSTISFSGLKATLPDRGGSYPAANKQFNAMVYVFCLQDATTHAQYDVLDIGQWEFYVLPRTVLADRGYGSIALGELRRLALKLRAHDLPDAVRMAAAVP